MRRIRYSHLGVAYSESLRGSRCEPGSKAKDAGQRRQGKTGHLRHSIDLDYVKMWYILIDNQRHLIKICGPSAVPCLRSFPTSSLTSSTRKLISSHSAFTLTTRMSAIQALRVPVRRWMSTRILSQQRATYATETNATHVQTPIQTKDKSTIPSPLRPQAESRSAQTPVQSQKPAQVAAQARRARPSNAGPLYTFLGCLVATPFVTYFYWEYRKERMGQKKDALMEKAKDRLRKWDG